MLVRQDGFRIMSIGNNLSLSESFLDWNMLRSLSLSESFLDWNMLRSLAVAAR